jgi:hypothetical protein
MMTDKHPLLSSVKSTPTDDLNADTLYRRSYIISLMTSLITLVMILTCSPVFSRHTQNFNAGPLQIEVTDAQQTQLPSYHHQGKFYILGRHHQRYMIKVTNTTSQRYEVVLTVDGRDVINGQPGAYRHRGYVIDPYETIDVEGFRRSSTEVATFRFTTPGDSYASRMGSRQNIGVIGAAVFAERSRIRVPHRRFKPSARLRKSSGALSGQYDAEDVAPSRGGGLGSASHSMSAKKSSRRRSHQSEIGTQYGERRHSATQETTFVRTSSHPFARLMITYDSERGLRRRGVIYHTPAPPSSPRPFPEESSYATPPPGYR